MSNEFQRLTSVSGLRIVTPEGISEHIVLSFNVLRRFLDSDMREPGRAPTCFNVLRRFLDDPNTGEDFTIDGGVSTSYVGFWTR